MRELQPVSSLCRLTADIFAQAYDDNVSLDSTLQSALEDLRIRFLSWGGNVGAFAPGNASIDYRLREDPDIEELLGSLLVQLNDDLRKALAPALESVLEEDEDDMESDDEEREYGRGMCSQSNDGMAAVITNDNISDIHSSSSSSVMSGSTDTCGSSSCSDGLNNGKAGTGHGYALVKRMEKAVGKLHQLSAVLRKTVSVNEDARIRAFIERRRDKDDKEQADLQTHARWYLGHCFPNMDQFLKDRLVDTIVFRRMMLLYRERHHRKLQQGYKCLPPPLLQVPGIVNSEELLEHVTTLASSDSTASSNHGRHTTASAFGSSALLSETNASSVDRDVFAAQQHGREGIINRHAVSVITRTGVIRRGKLDIPSAPKAQLKEGKSATCPFCFHVIEEEEVKQTSWPRHVLKDLRPYICLFPNCEQSQALFRTPEDWLAHIQTRHATVWCCLNPQHQSTTYGSGQALKEHFALQHPELSKEQANRLITNAAVAIPDVFSVLSKEMEMEAGVCPFCKTKPDASELLLNERKDGQEVEKPTVLYHHILQHLEALALKSLPETDLAEDASTDGSDGHTSLAQNSAGTRQAPSFTAELESAHYSDQKTEEITNLMSNFEDIPDMDFSMQEKYAKVITLVTGGLQRRDPSQNHLDIIKNDKILQHILMHQKQKTPVFRGSDVPFPPEGETRDGESEQSRSDASNLFPNIDSQYPTVGGVAGTPITAPAQPSPTSTADAPLPAEAKTMDGTSEQSRSDASDCLSDIDLQHPSAEGAPGTPIASSVQLSPQHMAAADALNFRGYQGNPRFDILLIKIGQPYLKTWGELKSFISEGPNHMQDDQRKQTLAFISKCQHAHVQLVLQSRQADTGELSSSQGLQRTISAEKLRWPPSTLPNRQFMQDTDVASVEASTTRGWNLGAVSQQESPATPFMKAIILDGIKREQKEARQRQEDRVLAESMPQVSEAQNQTADGIATFGETSPSAIVCPFCDFQNHNADVVELHISTMHNPEPTQTSPLTTTSVRFEGGEDGLIMAAEGFRQTSRQSETTKPAHGKASGVVPTASNHVLGPTKSSMWQDKLQRMQY
ncbi:hypothetical protein BJ508DRAFT_118081 [Ascobolus immersus RN42]|uniref:C2H2-type domain-containing protein n=1 Tax=Ascobolus immersus RN42 TaxID=1160509 RepID=A0A3N4I4H9_ASCIM|nr:hypothetical protein BJ508DRAFT_118081 [Ascobolus immersus RN42]